MNEKAYWIALSSVRGIGPTRFAALLDMFGTAQAVWTAPVERLTTVRLGRRTLENLVKARHEVEPDALWQRVQRGGFQCLTWDDAAYPANLRETDGSPPVLYVDGVLSQNDELSVAIVGTRRASAYGREVAHHLATALAQNGVTVVSGLALGIDTVAHRAALDAGGRTLAVLGSGVDQVYPAQNRTLADEIRIHGAIISEYWLGTRPEAMNFPPRNRIISGLSRTVIIVEAGERSGALITATFAAEQGRDVYAVPGSILHPGNVGCNRLIQQGASPLLSVDEVLEHLRSERMPEKAMLQHQTVPEPPEEQLLDHLSNIPIHVDDISRRAALPAARIGALLAVMELKGLVRQVGALQYVKV